MAARVEWGKVTPTSTMRSRTVREMRVSVNAESVGLTGGGRPPSELGRVDDHDVGHLVHRAAEQRHPVVRQLHLAGSPPGCARPPRRRPGPSSWAAAAAARAAGATGQGLADPPLPHPQGEGVGTGAEGDELHVDPPGWIPLEPASRARPRRCRPDRDRAGPGGDCPRRPAGPVGRRTPGAGRARGVAAPMSTEAQPRPGRRPRGTRRCGPRPAVATVNVGGSPGRHGPPPGPGSACRCRSSRPRRRRRSCSSMVRSARRRRPRIRITPSAPTPNLPVAQGPHQRRPERGRASSRSTRTRKSLPAPWCLVRWRVESVGHLRGHGAVSFSHRAR